MKRFIIAALLCLGLAACATPPLIARDLPTASQDANANFDQQIKARFAAGTPESALLAELMRENFKLAPCADPSGQGCVYQRFAELKAEGLPCRRDWQILWNVDAGQISKIEGRYYTSCG